MNWLVDGMTLTTTGAFIVAVVVATAVPFWLAVSVAVVFAATGVDGIPIVTLVAPAGIVTEVLGVSAGLDELRTTVVPPVGAGLTSVTVRAGWKPPRKVEGLSVN